MHAGRWWLCQAKPGNSSNTLAAACWQVVAIALHKGFVNERSDLGSDIALLKLDARSSRRPIAHATSELCWRTGGAAPLLMDQRLACLLGTPRARGECTFPPPRLLCDRHHPAPGAGGQGPGPRLWQVRGLQRAAGPALGLPLGCSRQWRSCLHWHRAGCRVRRGGLTPAPHKACRACLAPTPASSTEAYQQDDPELPRNVAPILQQVGRSPALQARARCDSPQARQCSARLGGASWALRALRAPTRPRPPPHAPCRAAMDAAGQRARHERRRAVRQRPVCVRR